MAIITFMSDFGHRDHYVAAVKAKIFNINPHINLVDISHQVDCFNIAHASYVLKAVYRDFPKGTVHLVSVNTASKPKERLIAMKFDDHYFVGADNGIFSLMSDNSEAYLAVELEKDSLAGLFPETTILAPAAVSLAGGTPMMSLGKQVNDIRQMLSRQLRITKTQIMGHAVHIDHYGNVITNITREAFEKVREGRSYVISFGRESVEYIGSGYNEGDPGDIVAIFNTNQQLEICLNSGNASELLGLHYDSVVNISFTGL